MDAGAAYIALAQASSSSLSACTPMSAPCTPPALSITHLPCDLPSRHVGIPQHLDSHNLGTGAIEAVLHALHLQPMWAVHALPHAGQGVLPAGPGTGHAQEVVQGGAQWCAALVPARMQSDPCVKRWRHACWCLLLLALTLQQAAVFSWRFEMPRWLHWHAADPSYATLHVMPCPCYKQWCHPQTAQQLQMACRLTPQPAAHRNPPKPHTCSSCRCCVPAPSCA